jgi:tRNA dimethylallyltransferase
MRDSLTSVQTLGYAQVLGHIDGNSTLDEAIEEMKRRTRRFARRQMSWFRSDPRIEWFEDAGDAGERLQTEF